MVLYKVKIIMEIISDEEFEKIRNECAKCFKISTKSTPEEYLQFASDCDKIGAYLARFEYQQCMAESELRRAEGAAYIAIKKNPNVFGVDKVSETTIKYLINVVDEVVTAREKLAKITYYVSRFRAMRDSTIPLRQWIDRNDRFIQNN